VTVALIPVNRLDRAKGRLSLLLTPAERRALLLASLRTVVDAASDARLEVLVLTPDPAVPGALDRPVGVIRETPGLSGLNPQLERALQGRDEALVLHADLPLASAAALRRLVASAAPAPSATLVRSRDGGTNAMLLRPPGRFPLAYGPGSHPRHAAAAEAAGMAVRTVAEPRLELDLDTAEDLAALLATEDGRACAAGRVLLTIDLAGRLPAPHRRGGVGGSKA
jgi:2-phospho-L-lactate guanylyltransferase